MKIKLENSMKTKLDKYVEIKPDKSVKIKLNKSVKKLNKSIPKPTNIPEEKEEKL